MTILVDLESKKKAIAQWIELLSGVPFNNIREVDQPGKIVYPGVLLDEVSDVDNHRPFRRVEEIDGELQYVVYSSRQAMIDIEFVTRDKGNYTELPLERVPDARHYMTKFYGNLYLPELSIEFLSQNGLSLLAVGNTRKTDISKKQGWRRGRTIEIGFGYVSQSAEPVGLITAIQSVQGAVYVFDDKFELEINLGPYQLLEEKGQPDGYASLDSEGKVPSSELPDLVKIRVFKVVDELEQLSLDVLEGDLCVRGDQNITYAALNSDNNSLNDWEELLAAPEASFISQDALHRFVSDAEKNFWNSKQEALGFTPENAAQKGAANGYASLGADSKIPGSQLPALAITSSYVVNSEAEQLALTVQEGDVAIRMDESQSYIAINDDNLTMADWRELLTPSSAVTSVDGQVGAVVLNGVYAALSHSHAGLDIWEDIAGVIKSQNDPRDLNLQSGRIGNGFDLTDTLARLKSEGTVSSDQVSAGSLNIIAGEGALGNSFWQSFTPAVSGQLVRIEIIRGTVGPGSVIGTIDIRQGEGVGGALLAGASFNFSAVGTIPLAFDKPAYLIAETKYTFVITITGGTGTLQFKFNNADGYGARGRFSPSPAWDMTFETFMSGNFLDFILDTNAGALNVNGNLKAVDLNVRSKLITSGSPSGATQGAAGAAVNEEWITSGHVTLPDGVKMRGI